MCVLLDRNFSIIQKTLRTLVTTAALQLVMIECDVCVSVYMCMRACVYVYVFVSLCVAWKYILAKKTNILMSNRRGHRRHYKIVVQLYNINIYIYVWLLNVV